MPQTTTYINACDVDVLLDDATGTPVDIAGSSNNISLSIQRSLGSLVTFEGDFDIVTACKRNATISYGGVYSTAINEARSIIEGLAFGDDGGPSARSLTFYLPSNEIGATRYDVEVVLESYELPIDASSADPIAITANFRTTGPFVRSIVAS